MKSADDNTPAVGKQLAGWGLLAYIYHFFLPPLFFLHKLRGIFCLRLSQKASEANLPVG